MEEGDVVNLLINVAKSFVDTLDGAVDVPVKDQFAVLRVIVGGDVAKTTELAGAESSIIRQLQRVDFLSPFQSFGELLLC